MSWLSRSSSVTLLVAVPGVFLTIGMVLLLFWRVFNPNSPSPWKKVRHALLRRGAGAPPQNFWAAWPQKSGVAPARFWLFSTVTFGFLAFAFIQFPRT